MTIPQLQPLIQHIIDDCGHEMPDGCDRWAVKTVRPDLRTRDGFRWPWPGGAAVADSPDPENTDTCPRRVGDGLCVAHTWAGMASGGMPARTLLLVAYSGDDVLGENTDKIRLRRCVVVDVADGEQLIRDHGADANLWSANLRGANLRGANLRRADLTGADLWRVDLTGADLRDADLTGADLTGADLRGADLTGADLRGTNLRRADLTGADLRGTNLRRADLTDAIGVDS